VLLWQFPHPVVFVTHRSTSCVCTRMHMCTCVGYVCMHGHMCACMYVWVYVYGCVCVYVSTYQTTWRYNPDNQNMNLHFYKNLKSYIPAFADNTFQAISRCSKGVLTVIQSCRLLQLNRIEARAIWYLHTANVCNSKPKAVKSTIFWHNDDRDFKWGAT
jgi:hypothetical protein